MLERFPDLSGPSGPPQPPHRPYPYPGSYRSAGPPSGLDRLLAGRSRADKEADQDAHQRLLIFGGLIFGVVIFVVWSFFMLLGLKLGIWSLPVFVPLWVWVFASFVLKMPLRPLAFSKLRGKKRLGRVALVLLAIWLAWPLWADPASVAWHAAHGGFGSFLTKPKYPVGAIIAASPFAMGVVAGLLVIFGMLATPDFQEHEPRPQWPPSSAVPLRSMLVSREDERGQQ